MAAAWVVAYHFGNEAWPFTTSALSGPYGHGSVAVSFFFFLSGFVLAYRYMPQKSVEWKGFMLKRLARIYPVYVVAFAASLVLTMLYRDAYPKGHSIILQLLSLHSWNPGRCLEINFPAWSISVEMFFYALFPLLVGVFGRTDLKRATLVTLAVWMASAAVHYGLSTEFYEPGNMVLSEFNLYFPLWHLNTFLFGMLCAKVVVDNRVAKLKPAWCRGLYLLGAVLFVAVLSTDNPVRPFVHNGLLSPLFFLIVLGLTLDRSAVTRLLSWKPLVLLGDASYSLYILQWPVFLLFTHFIAPEPLDTEMFWAYFLLLTVISVTVYSTFEKRMKELILKKWL